MIHWLNAKRSSWVFARRPSPSLLTSEDFIILSALDRSNAKDTERLINSLNPPLASTAIEESLHRLLQHGLIHRLVRAKHVRYKLSRAGTHFLADSEFKH